MKLPAVDHEMIKAKCKINYEDTVKSNRRLQDVNSELKQSRTPCKQLIILYVELFMYSPFTGNLSDVLPIFQGVVQAMELPSLRSLTLVKPPNSTST